MQNFFRKVVDNTFESLYADNTTSMVAGGRMLVNTPHVKSKRAPRARRIARHRVRNSIEHMIVNGRFRPGEKLVQLQLSRQFGVSLGMVREALFELEGLGLVESFDNLGVRVRSLDAQAMHELYVLREVFDGVAARQNRRGVVNERVTQERPSQSSWPRVMRRRS